MSFCTALSIIIVLAIAFSASTNLGLRLVNAQNVTTANFISYQNPILGFSIKHPADWKVHESDFDKGAVEFKTSDDETLSIFLIDIENVTQYLDTDTLTLKNTSLLQHVKQSQEEHSRIAPDFKLIRQYEVTVAVLRLHYIGLLFPLL